MIALLGVGLGLALAAALWGIGLLIGRGIQLVRDVRRGRTYFIWRRLFWLPDPIYYWLLDRFTDNNGWRPLGYRGRDGV
jgi:hypothetical protein